MEAAAAAASALAAAAPAFHTIAFWRNGFTVDDGPLRGLTDPANVPFLEVPKSPSQPSAMAATSINRGECPRELEPAERSTPVHVNLVKKDEDWEAPQEPKYVAFGGTGRTLGQAAAEQPAAVAAPAANDRAAMAAPASKSSSGNQPSQGKQPDLRTAAAAGIVIDGSQPVTSVQVRLADGARLVARFNHGHTVGDVRRFVEAARPVHGAFSLQAMSFPPRVLADDSLTIVEAGLINSVIIQKGC
eukprot:SM000015S01167  [mRNA]  locus=s15:124868:126493:- [translate_table: standard]